MGSLTSFQIVILIPLLTAGMTALFWDIYAWWHGISHKKDGKKIDENERIAVCVIIGIACLFINLLWFVPKVVVGDVVKEVVEAQDYNCRNTTTKDGDSLSENQCWYFEDVLNGKYNEYENKLDIQSFLGK